MEHSSPKPTKLEFEPNQKAFNELQQMISTMRPCGSRTEIEFVEKWITSLPGARILGSYENVIIDVQHKNGASSNVMYSSHFDTVHRKAGWQRTHYDNQTQTIRLGRKEKVANCLGADCTAGVWLMRQMILAKHPGLYVFHGGEEWGGLGSSELAQFHHAEFNGIDACIAFDRYGFNSIITHQGERCCSDSFAKSLGKQLGIGWELDNTGLFTDSANYTDIIPECTNVSVGYLGHHTDKESLHLGHLFELLDSLVRMDEKKLTIERDPTVPDNYYKDWQDDEYYSYGKGNYNSADLLSFVKDHPEAAADLIEQFGLSVADCYESVGLVQS